MINVLTKVLLLFAFVLLFQITYSQIPTVTGTVADENGSPIVGASISFKVGKAITTTSDLEKFSISVPKDTKTLLISYVGMQEQKVGIGKDSISVRLKSLSTDLNDVVIIGYGKMKKSDLSSAVLSISGAALDKTVNVTLDEALQGKVPNVFVSQTSEQHGAGSSVIIRGVSTLTGNYI